MPSKRTSRQLHTLPVMTFSADALIGSVEGASHREEPVEFVARELVAAVRKHVTIDWTLGQNLLTQLRALAKRIVRNDACPPDLSLLKALFGCDRRRLPDVTTAVFVAACRLRIHRRNRRGHYHAASIQPT